MLALFKASQLLSFVIFFLPKKWKHSFGLLLHVLLVISSSSAAVFSLWNQQVVEVNSGIVTWSGPILITIDPLSSFFILAINLICICGVIYARGYLKPYINRKSAPVLSMHLISLLWLHAAMLMIVSSRDGIAFLLSWEVMSLTSFILVIFDGHKENILKTGINYLLQMHLSFALIMLGFLVASEGTTISFDAVGDYFSQHPNAPLFMLFFAGFGIKAGFMPMHTWLPRAHPAAPSHVSAIMSGIMIKMGIYGILRVSQYVQQDWFVIGLWVLFFAILSGIMGVIMAILQHDLKRLLAYHSIENIGIIGIGIGVSFLGKAFNDPNLYALGLAGALLHTLNHALFKSLLFFSAGNLKHSVHTVNMDHLGGIINKMRLTGFAFLIGALAISGIPPFNGFISEFLIYSGIISNFPNAGFAMVFVGTITIISLVTIGGLCLFCFTKAFGMSFLGTMRTNLKPEVKEVEPIMIVPLMVIIAVIISIGIFPAWYGGILHRALATTFNVTIQADVLNSLFSIGRVDLVVIGVIGAIVVWKLAMQRKAVIAQGPTWGCGYSAGDYRHQYTPTSYAENIREIIQYTVDSSRQYEHIKEEEIFPERRKFVTENKDLMEEKTILPTVNFLVYLLPKLGLVQTGRIHHYLIYPLVFLIVIVLISYLNFI
jgi:formate hydrogenlyase subunit 3/multisubunit Na+/H+ antiporter MnhD subunit